MALSVTATHLLNTSRGNCTLFSPFWFPIALACDPTLHSSPLISGLCFQSCLQIFRCSIFISRNFRECSMAPQRADAYHSVLVRSFITPWCPVTELCCHSGLGSHSSNIPAFEFLSKLNHSGSKLGYVHNRYQTERLSFYDSIYLSTGILQGMAGFLRTFCTKGALV